MTDLLSSYAKDYRKKMNLPSQGMAKRFLSGKDLVTAVDYTYIASYNQRIEEIFTRLNAVVDPAVRPENLKDFLDQHLYHPHDLMIRNEIIPLLTNHGRRPEDVYASWMRGFVASEYFKFSIQQIFSVRINQISAIGKDDFRKKETFIRSPEADCQITLRDGTVVRLEIQSGYQGINDIKKHKVNEAIRVYQESGIPSLCLHFDIFNGLVAFARLDTITEDDANWVSRSQMEGQLVFTIDMNSFLWKLLEKPPHIQDLEVL